MSTRSTIMTFLIISIVAGLLFMGWLRRLGPGSHFRRGTMSLLRRIDRSVHEFDRLVAHELRPAPRASDRAGHPAGYDASSDDASLSN